MLGARCAHELAALFNQLFHAQVGEWACVGAREAEAVHLRESATAFVQINLWRTQGGPAAFSSTGQQMKIHRYNSTVKVYTR